LRVPFQIFTAANLYDCRAQHPRRQSYSTYDTSVYSVGAKEKIEKPGNECIRGSMWHCAYALTFMQCWDFCINITQIHDRIHIKDTCHMRCRGTGFGICDDV
jgi:hypothetical protein